MSATSLDDGGHEHYNGPRMRQSGDVGGYEVESARGSKLQHHAASDLDAVEVQVENVEVGLPPLTRVPITLHVIHTLPELLSPLGNFKLRCLVLSTQRGTFSIVLNEGT